MDKLHEPVWGRMRQGGGEGFPQPLVLVAHLCKSRRKLRVCCEFALKCGLIGRSKLAVDKAAQAFIICGGHEGVSVSSGPRTKSEMDLRARAKRLITVPMGMPKVSAATL